ncbi:hypothetical protein LTR66_000517 [Elasticomyces elasticus]|nr:hypothetical protein LTR66_000517 [Elasticomyces elasticus]
MIDLGALEHQRQQLEQNITNLSKSLQYWQTWEAEYEGLKEEVSRVTDEPTVEVLRFEISSASLAVHVEVGTKSPISSPDGRNQNISTTQEQLDLAQDKLQSVLNASQPGSTTAAALPMTEIYEELDDEGNVISSRMVYPDQAATAIVKTLQEAGVTDLDDRPSSPVIPDPDHMEQRNGPVSTAGRALSVVGSTPPGAPSPTELSKSNSEYASGKEPVRPRPRKKSVSFSHDTKPPAAESEQRSRKESVSFASEVAIVELPVDTVTEIPPKRVSPSLINGSFSSHDRVIELNTDDEVIGTTPKTPIAPSRESPEDARLRREMLEYGLGEVGSIVAELDLDETYSDDEDQDSDFDDDDTSYNNSDQTEDEDEYGRSTKRVLSDKYRREMLELEKKLQARMIENTGPRSDRFGPEHDPSVVQRLAIRTKDDVLPDSRVVLDKRAAKKGVRFTDQLDDRVLAPMTSTTNTSMATLSGQVTIADVKERRPQADESEARTTSNVKPSRFKREREVVDKDPASDHTPPVIFNKPLDDSRPEGPPGQTLATNVIERPTTALPAGPPDSDGYDPLTQQQVLSNEYYRMRNNMINKQGGFKASEEEAAAPLMEERDGKIKKVSRFKAARLR